MSTRFCWRNGSRLAETASTNSMSSAAMPSLAAMSFAISTSKPSGQALQAEQRLVELGADAQLAGVGELLHARALGEVGVLGRRCGVRLLLAVTSTAGGHRQGERRREGERAEAQGSHDRSFSCRDAARPALFGCRWS
jgi:hypothetical protein